MATIEEITQRIIATDNSSPVKITIDGEDRYVGIAPRFGEGSGLSFESAADLKVVIKELEKGVKALEKWEKQ